jgi:hemerythrin-like domain-containing protein
MKNKDPINPFLQEHKHMLGRVQTLEQCADEIRVKGYSQRRATHFARALQAVTGEICLDQVAEEKTLLKTLDPMLPPRGPTFVLREEYKELRRLTQRMQRCLHSLQTHPTNTRTLARLSLTTELFIKLLREHIGKEDAVFFPLVRGLLSPKQMNEAGRRFKKAVSAA